MKEKILVAVFTVLNTIACNSVIGQTRFLDSVFANYTLNTVTYSSVFNQQMDIYEPAGDTARFRPVVVLAHGGSFTSGDRTNDAPVVWLCQDLAHKGYVTVSIDYRLSSTLNMLLGGGDSAIAEVLRAVSDGKAAVRYLYKDVYGPNLFRIDTNNIFIGGNSAGSILFLQYAYIDSVAELSSTYTNLLPMIGGTLQGNSGNAGYSTNFKGVVNLAGGIGQPDWIGFCSKPIVSAQGTADPMVPYDCGRPEYNTVPVTLCGLDSMQPYISSNTPYSASLTFPGAGHVPWEGGGADFYMVDTLITNFLFKALSEPVNPNCRPLGVADIPGNTNQIFPNPASQSTTIVSDEIIKSVKLIDLYGHQISNIEQGSGYSAVLDVSVLDEGLYFVIISGSRKTEIIKLFVKR